MSIDVTFKPSGPTAVVNAAGVQILAAGNVPPGVVSFRIYNASASGSQVIGWGATAALAVANAAVPGPGMTVNAGASLYLEVPYNSFFAGSGTTPIFQITPGSGGVGG
jgi:hypothetical protein